MAPQVGDKAEEHAPSTERATGTGMIEEPGKPRRTRSGAAETQTERIEGPAPAEDSSVPSEPAVTVPRQA